MREAGFQEMLFSNLLWRIPGENIPVRAGRDDCLSAASLYDAVMSFWNALQREEFSRMTAW